MLELAGTARPREMPLVEQRAAARPDHLSTASSGFVGRAAELDQIARLLLGPARLITLIGSGGIGKTRLAAEALGDFQRNHRVVVHWARLARLPGGAAACVIAAEVTRAVLGSEAEGWEATVEALSAARGERRILLMMDNCEHVIDGAGRVIADLLDTVPGLTIVATSREPIEWVDEQLLSVPPLTRQEAIDLFCERAEFAGCRVGERDQLATVAQICVRVHNHPLFVRLAAARLLRQPLAVVLRELSGTDSDRRMDWSHGPRVGAEARHQRLRDVIGWSYELCAVPERLLLERMSVFAADLDLNPAEESDGRRVGRGADLDAILSICVDEEHGSGDGAVRLARDEIEGLLTRLVDRSLVSRRITKTSVRYYLVESVRLFARRALCERADGGPDELARLTKRHRRYYRDIVIRVRADWGGPAERVARDDWMRPAWNNIVAALELSGADTGERAVAVDLVAAMFPLPLVFLGDSVAELRDRIERVLAIGDATPPRPDRPDIPARAMVAWLALCQGHIQIAAPLLDECFAACGLATAEWRRSPETDAGLPAPAEFAWGIELVFARRDARAAIVFARARDKYRRDGDRAGVVASELSRRLAAGLLGSAEPGQEQADCGPDHEGVREGMAVADLIAAGALTRHRDSVRALTLERQALQRLVATGDRWGALWAVQSRVWSLARKVESSARTVGSGKRDVVEVAIEAARLIGGANTLRARLGIDIAGLGPYADRHHSAIEILADFLGHEAYTRAEQQGALLGAESDELPRFALGTLAIDDLPPEHPTRQHVPSYWDDLTLAEEQVAVLAAAGWTNTAIATRRGSSFKTVNAQMVSVFQKLNITSRGEIIGLVPDDKVDQVRAESVQRPRRRARAQRVS
ncbi:helix-turn-helix transcriptional regulator [Nocardia altamirensis]|uniref:helix-turn-helix transcriptional regulator n=1 Tax=Nocardia altamirensis TaxID=472158 RepID=UPI0008406D20|nr:LuxR C-terminal-related transcriptional regulator [Nocardia altamirensis]